MKELPIADMRGVTFDPAERVYSRRKGDLCERCGRYDKCSKSTKIRQDAFVMSTCKSFLPIVLFVDTTGTDDEFTTIRLGLAWQKRVDNASRVALFSKKQGYYGEASVTFVDGGLKEDIIYSGSRTNHMMLDFEGKDHFKSLCDIVKKAYGNLIWKHNDQATIIGLRRET